LLQIDWRSDDRSVDFLFIAEIAADARRGLQQHLGAERERGIVMTYRKPLSVRWCFLSSLLEGIHVTWPVLSSLLILQAGLGVVVGEIERWGAWKGIYFALITGLTIGYGDLVPQQSLTRILAVAIGFFGIALTGIVAALAVRALQATADARNAEKMAAHDIQ
jgi:voltage-gated potassium channel